MQFLFEQKIEVATEQVWEFHTNPANIMLLMREKRGFQLMRHGARVTVGGTIWFQEMVGMCVPMVLGFRHAQVMPGSGFVDEIIHGPFKQFIHRHSFIPEGNGTLVRDELDVLLPWHLGGAPATRYLVGPGLRESFACRNKALAQWARGIQQTSGEA